MEKSALLPAAAHRDEQRAHPLLRNGEHNDEWKLVIRRNTMNIETLTTFFMWCTILNFALLILASLIGICAKDWAYGMHSKWFGISRETFNVAIYSFLGLYKVLIFVFSLTPYIALLIVG